MEGSRASETHGHRRGRTSTARRSGSRRRLAATLGLVAAAAAAAWLVNILLLRLYRGSAAVPQGAATVGVNNMLSGDAFFLVVSAVTCGLVGYAAAAGPRRFWEKLQQLPATSVAMARRDPLGTVGYILVGGGLSILLELAVAPVVAAVLALGVVLALVLRALLAVLIGVVTKRMRPGVARRSAALPVRWVIVGAAVASVVGAVVTPAPIHPLVGLVSLLAGAGLSLAGRRSIVIAGVAALSCLLLMVISASAATMPLRADQVRLDLAGGTPQATCSIHSGAPTGCQDGPPTFAVALALNAGAGGVADLSVTPQVSGQFSYTSTIAESAPGSFTLSSNGGSWGSTAIAPFSLTGSGTSFSGHFSDSAGRFTWYITLSLPGQGLVTVASTPPTTASVTPPPSQAPVVVPAAPVGAVGSGPADPVISLLPALAAAVGAPLGAAVGAAVGVGDALGGQPTGNGPGVEPVPVGTVNDLKGNLSVMRANGSEWIPATIGMQLYPLDHIKADEHSVAAITIGPLGTAGVDKGVELQVNADGTTTPIGTAANQTLILKRGSVWCKFERYAPAFSDEYQGYWTTIEGEKIFVPPTKDRSGAPLNPPPSPAPDAPTTDASAPSDPQGDPLDNLPPPT